MIKIIITILVATIVGLLSNVIATWIEPRLKKSIKWTVAAFVFFTIITIGLVYYDVLSTKEKPTTNDDLTTISQDLKGYNLPQKVNFYGGKHIPILDGNIYLSQNEVSMGYGHFDNYDYRLGGLNIDSLKISVRNANAKPGDIYYHSREKEIEIQINGNRNENVPYTEIEYKNMFFEIVVNDFDSGDDGPIISVNRIQKPTMNLSRVSELKEYKSWY